MAINPLFYNNFWKNERHNSTRPICNIYAKQIEQMISIYGISIFFYPISEYSFDSISKLWGEDINKKYLEKYTLKCINEGENDNFTFNRFGVDKTSAERVIYISAKAFTEITGRKSPLEDDMFLYSQNKIVYQITEVSNNESIILGMETAWKIIGIPRLVEGEWFGKDDCNATRDPVVDGSASDVDGKICDKNSPPIGDGDVITDPLNVHVPGPTPHIIDDESTIDAEKASTVIRSSWGNW